MSGTILREPAEETLDLYPDLVVHDDRVTGSITIGRSRLPIWTLIGPLLMSGWDETDEEWKLTERGWPRERVIHFLAHLLDNRGEFARLLLVLADVERLADDVPRWYEQEQLRQRVLDQLRRCVMLLEQMEP